jgi:hypothetical protein
MTELLRRAIALRYPQAIAQIEKLPSDQQEDYEN